MLKYLAVRGNVLGEVEHDTMKMKYVIPEIEVFKFNMPAILMESIEIGGGEGGGGGGSEPGTDPWDGNGSQSDEEQDDEGISPASESEQAGGEAEEEFHEDPGFSVVTETEVDSDFTVNEAVDFSDDGGDVDMDSSAGDVDMDSGF